MTDRPEPTAEHIDAVAWPFGYDSAARVLAVCSWPNDGQIEEWAPRVFREPTDARQREIERAASRFIGAGRAVGAGPDVDAALAANLPTDVMLTALVERGWKPDAVARVEALHARRRGKDPVTLGPRDYCSSHDHPSLTDWPCRTIRALMEPAP